MITTPNAFASQVFQLLNYGAPLLLAAYYIGASVISRCTLTYEKARPVSGRRRSWLVGLCFTATICYLAQSLSFIPNIAHVPDDSLVYALSQTLLWTSLSLIGLSTASPAPPQGVVLINFVTQAIVCAFTFSGFVQVPPNSLYALEALQLLTLLVLALLSAIKCLFLFRHTDGITSERQSLLDTSSTKSVPSEPSTTGYNTLSNAGEDANSEDGHSDSDYGSDSDSDDDDEKELKASQRKRLKETGSWFAYLKSFKIFLPYVYPKESIRLQIYVGVIIISELGIRALNVLQPRQLGIIVDKLAQEGRVPWAAIIVWMIIELIASDWCGLGAAVELCQNRITAWSRQKLATASLDHVMGLSMTFHDQKDSGEIIKAIEQASSINDVLEKVILDLVPGALDIIIAIWFVTFLFDVYALLILAAASIAFVFVTYHATVSATDARRVFTHKDRLQSKIIYESVSSWFTVMCMNRKAETMNRLSGVVEEAAQAELRNEDIFTYMAIGQELSEKFGRFSLTILAARRIAAGTSSIGDLVTLNSYWDALIMPFYVLAHSTRDLNSDMVDAERLLQLFQELPTVQDAPDAISLPGNITGKISFDDVSFSYPGRGDALHNFNMTAHPGQMVALVGETGSGKSTTLKLLMRFYDVTSGRITVDDHDTRDLTLTSLRQCFGFVPQDSVLFNTTILENVRYARPAATDAEVVAACEAASIHTKILTFPQGYASKVGERGVKMSGGERQRIAIARVFLKDPQVVLLDEATSAMDSATESKIQEALRRLMKGRTTFVVAHRLSTVVDADRILVVDRGGVAESGSHDELLAKRGRYFDLWAKQASRV